MKVTAILAMIGSWLIWCGVGLGAMPETSVSLFDRAARGLVACYEKGTSIDGRAFTEFEGCTRQDGQAILDKTPTTAKRVRALVKRQDVTPGTATFASHAFYAGEVTFILGTNHCTFPLELDNYDGADGDTTMVVEGKVVCL